MKNKLFVGGLSYSTTEDGLRAAFEDCGTVDSVRIIMDRDTGRSKGFGFVEMATEEQAEGAIEKLNGVDLDGRQINVSEAKEKKPRERRF